MRNQCCEKLICEKPICEKPICEKPVCKSQFCENRFCENRSSTVKKQKMPANTDFDVLDILDSADVKD